MKDKLTDIVFVIDRSGSMRGLEQEVQNGFNSMLEKQREVTGKAFVTTIMFDDDSEIIHDRVNVKEVKNLTAEDYAVKGCTALLDAVGGAVTHIKNIHKYSENMEQKKTAMFVIITDGLENASRIYKYINVKRMIEQQKECGWEFIFLGANMDAVAVASRIGIDENRAVEYNCDEIGIAVSYLAVSDTISGFRTDGEISDDWCGEIAEDFMRHDID